MCGLLCGKGSSRVLEPGVSPTRCPLNHSTFSIRSTFLQRGFRYGGPSCVRNVRTRVSLTLSPVFSREDGSPGSTFLLGGPLELSGGDSDVVLQSQWTFLATYVPQEGRGPVVESTRTEWTTRVASCTDLPTSGRGRATGPRTRLVDCPRARRTTAFCRSGRDSHRGTGPPLSCSL